MSSSNVAALPGAGSSSYVQNLVRATLALFAAIFAIAPRRLESTSDEEVAARDALMRLAAKVGSTMPNQAAELRYFAR